jgi:hypothetical protein
MSFLLAELGFSQNQRQRVYFGFPEWSASFYCDPGKPNVNNQASGETIYTLSCKNNGLTMGLICVRLKEKITDRYQSTQNMIAYMNFLRNSQKITRNIGIGNGEKLPDYPSMEGILDFWTDDNGNEWELRSWTDGYHMAVMYVSGSKELLAKEATMIRNFLFSIRFPVN